MADGLQAKDRPTIDQPVEPLAELATLISALGSDREGLSSTEAAHRLRRFGPNSLSRTFKASSVRLLLADLFDPLSLLLWAAAALTALVELPQLAAAIVAVILLNGLFAFVQERQAEHATEQLRTYLAQTAIAWRNRKLTRIPASEVVPGDLIELREGERVCADIRPIEGAVEIDMASLTGESQPQLRIGADVGQGRLLESENVVFAGTTCTSGLATGFVFATGLQTQLGRIASLTEDTTQDESPLRVQMRAAARVIALVSVAIGVVFVPLGLIGGLGLTGAVVFASSLLVANVPEGLLPTITLALAVGVRRMARRGALVKRLAATEGLGATTVICTDKTGTLTLNQMRAIAVWTPERMLAEPFIASHHSPLIARLANSLARCNNVAQGTSADKPVIAGDPTEIALLDLARDLHDVERSRRLVEFSFNSRLKRMSTLDETSDGVVLSVKGAPEVIVPLCRSVAGRGQLDIELRGEVERAYSSIASRGLRVLAIADRVMPSREVPSRGEAESKLELIGLVGLHDPPRPEVPAAVAKCKRAGVQILVVTGDNPLTARDIARRVGIVDDRAVVLTGSDIEGVSEQELGEMARPGVIFARTSPEDKLRIVDALQARGEVVAVTGDGVNDAPALRTADIGVAMGLSGTDVAREVAAVILTDDNFATIVNAIEEGRVIYANIKKFVVYIFAHAPPEAIPFIIFALSGGTIPVPLTVMQILAIDLGTETLPALALGREPAEPGVMERGPRAVADPLITRQLLWRAWGVMGLSVTICTLSAFFYALWRSGWTGGSGDLAAHTSEYAIGSTMAFLAIVACQVGTAFAARSELASSREIGMLTNRPLLWGIGLELIFATAIVFLPPLQQVFGTVTPTWDMLLLIVPFPFVVWGVDEWYRARLRTRQARLSKTEMVSPFATHSGFHC